MSAVGDILLASDVRPFAVAAAIMVALGGIELLTTMIGLSISEFIGKDFAVEAENHNALSGLFLWINAGRLPLLILIILILGVFSIGGFLLQGLAHAVGTAIPVSIAALAAAAGSIPVIRNASRGLARIIPRDESYAVSESDFVGQVATVSVGPLDQGLPGRVRLKDVFGNWHTVSARASHDSQALPVGASVLLVDRDAKSFIAIAAPADLIEQQQSSIRA
ncbi:membrane protein [Bradyrhizobium sp. LTSPM299]|uniref:OB-fold-containig protein n=1 Tax=Bradyrhizobium sp. LTSPM299 TaxID=1619233 RepID=UPI0005CA8E23|nr:OB-fold-containig protein [Bradyrhizobium sp. LTSPM299]KJC58885.1 membrane protein [Bradyrhizobium sp. LTSPM299]